jgi:phospholipase C
VKTKFKLNYAYAALAVVALSGLAGCNDSLFGGDSDPVAVNEKKAVDDIQNVVVIYAENRSFDNLYNDFPGIDSPLSGATIVGQKDRSGPTSSDLGSDLTNLPPVWGGLTVPAAGQFVATTDVSEADTESAFQAGVGVGTNGVQYFSINSDFATDGMKLEGVNRDMYHRFYENQMQIDGGKNDGFVAWGDSGGMVMGLFTGAELQRLPLRAWARQYTLADHWFQGAFGGSYLNHQYLIASAAPRNVASDPNHPPLSVIDSNDPQGTTLGWNLEQKATSPASAMDGPPQFTASTNTTPDGYSVNTMQPPYQPSSNAQVDMDGNDKLLANPASASTLPPQTQDTIGSYLTSAKVSWGYYSGGWGTMLACRTAGSVAGGTGCPTSSPAPFSQMSTSPSSHGYNYGGAYTDGPNGATGTKNATGSNEYINFQFHHQPFNYYAAFDPSTTEGAANRAAHLLDAGDKGEKFMADIDGGKLPAVSFYKPVGTLNEHNGYTDVMRGDQHIADVLTHLKNSPQWKHMLVVVTYDENGGSWDHVAPPKGDRFGPGSRIPALIIGPNVKKGYVDHTMYDTTSILRFITRRWDLPTLPGLQQRIDALKDNNGGTPQGDLSTALLVSGS